MNIYLYIYICFVKKYSILLIEFHLMSANIENTLLWKPEVLYWQQKKSISGNIVRETTIT